MKTVRQELTYKDIYDSEENIWSVLFTTGYLTRRGRADGNRIRLAILNKEILNIFERTDFTMVSGDGTKRWSSFKCFLRSI